MITKDIYEIVEDLKFVLNANIDEINSKEREEDTALLNAFLEEIKYYENLLKSEKII